MPADTLQQYHADPALEDRIKVYPSDGITYVAFNVFQPPMDDIHVRKAINWVIDRAGSCAPIGGPTRVRSRAHLPRTVDAGRASDRTTTHTPTPDERGDVAKAKEEMKQSKYDSDGDGVCDAPDAPSTL